MPNDTPRDVILEYTRIGNSVRVTAVDTATGTEVMFQAPATASQADMQRTAISKLKYVMSKQKQ